MSILTTPPAWQPDAKPSTEGWRHPITNELLVSVPGGVSLPEVEGEVTTEVEQPKRKIKKVVPTEGEPDAK